MTPIMEIFISEKVYANYDKVGGQLQSVVHLQLIGALCPHGITAFYQRNNFTRDIMLLWKL
jgi:hypothetical protein